jgi:hypothetical protein
MEVRVAAIQEMYTRQLEAKESSLTLPLAHTQ